MAPAGTLAPYINEFQTGMAVQDAAISSAKQLGHQLGSWEPYGKASMKALCVGCGAEVRIPYSPTAGGFKRHEGQAVNPALGNCTVLSRRFPNRKRGER